MLDLKKSVWIGATATTAAGKNITPLPGSITSSMPIWTIPAGYVTVDGITLGKWLARLRRIYEKSGTTTRALSDTRKAMLDHLGMKWPEQQPNRKTA